MAVVASLSDSVQLLDVSNPSSITEVSNIDDMDGDYVLDGPKEITSFKINSSTYVAVTAEIDNGVQILDVSTPSSITATDSITDTSDLKLSNPHGITSFKIGSSTYSNTHKFLYMAFSGHHRPLTITSLCKPSSLAFQTTSVHLDEFFSHKFVN